MGRLVATGVTTLDLDHTQTLGSTLGAIAYEKGGVYKRGVPALTVPRQTRPRPSSAAAPVAGPSRRARHRRRAAALLRILLLFFWPRRENNNTGVSTGAAFPGAAAGRPRLPAASGSHRR